MSKAKSKTKRAIKQPQLYADDRESPIPLQLLHQLDKRGHVKLHEFADAIGSAYSVVRTQVEREEIPARDVSPISAQRHQWRMFHSHLLEYFAEQKVEA